MEKKQGGYRQYSTDHWEVIDDMDQMKVVSLDELSQKLTLLRKKRVEQHYNVLVYKVLPYPPHAKDKQEFLRAFSDFPV